MRDWWGRRLEEVRAWWLNLPFRYGRWATSAAVAGIAALLWAGMALFLVLNAKDWFDWLRGHKIEFTAFFFLPPLILGAGSVACFSKARELGVQRLQIHDKEVGRLAVQAAVQRETSGRQIRVAEHGRTLPEPVSLTRTDFLLPAEFRAPTIFERQPLVDASVLRGVSEILSAARNGPLGWTQGERALVEKVFSAVSRLPFRPRDIFLSYSHNDGTHSAANLVALLKDTFDVSVWFDEHELEAGIELKSQIENGLTARIGVALVTPRYLELSPWIEKELTAFQQKEVLIPVLDGVTHDQMNARIPMLGRLVALNVQKDGPLGVAAKITTAVKRR